MTVKPKTTASSAQTVWPIKRLMFEPVASLFFVEEDDDALEASNVTDAVPVIVVPGIVVPGIVVAETTEPTCVVIARVVPCIVMGRMVVGPFTTDTTKLPVPSLVIGIGPPTPVPVYWAGTFIDAVLGCSPALSE